MHARRIGLIVNPVAGLGGSVGLKGSDSERIQIEARRLGALPVAEERARRALRTMREAGFAGSLLAAAGAMGEFAGKAEGLPVETTGEAGAATSAADTIASARRMRDAGADLIVFAGGDGTARDLHRAVDETVAMLGVPTGVKMHSGVFATSPETAGRLAARFASSTSSAITLRACEIMDIDEDAWRAGRLSPRLYGYGRVPWVRDLVQAPKRAGSPDDEAAVRAAACEIARGFAAGTAYVIGPGRSAKQVTAALGIETDVLGVDLVCDGRLLGSDLGEAELLHLAGNRPIGIVVGVTGGQGFVFGRGNQPISPAVIRRTSSAGLTIVAGRGKLSALAGARLIADTGDPALDAELAGYRRVIIGPGEEMVMRLVAG